MLKFVYSQDNKQLDVERLMNAKQNQVLHIPIYRKTEILDDAKEKFQKIKESMDDADIDEVTRQQ